MIIYDIFLLSLKVARFVIDLVVKVIVTAVIVIVYRKVVSCGLVTVRPRLLEATIEFVLGELVGGVVVGWCTNSFCVTPNYS